MHIWKDSYTLLRLSAAASWLCTSGMHIEYIVIVIVGVGVIVGVSVMHKQKNLAKSHHLTAHLLANVIDIIYHIYAGIRSAHGSCPLYND